MKYQTGDRVQLKKNLNDNYVVHRDSVIMTTITTTPLRIHAGHTFRITGIYESSYIATCECGRQYEDGDHQSGFWVLTEEMVKDAKKGRKPKELKIGRFERIIGGGP